MRHVVTLLFFVAATIAYVYGSGPNGALLGSVLVTVGLLFEITAWWRIMHKSGKSPAPMASEK